MKEELKIHELQIIQSLRKENLRPDEFIPLITKKIQDFETTLQAENLQSSFPFQLLIYTNKIINRKYKTFTDLQSVNTLLLQIMQLSLTYLRVSANSFLNILSSLLSTQCKFYNKTKNPIPQDQDIIMQSEIENYELFPIKLFNSNSYTLVNSFCMYNFNYFLKLEGFKIFVSFIENRPNFDDTSLILKIVQDIKACVHEEFWEKESKVLIDTVCWVIQTLKNEDVKGIQKESINRFMKNFSEFLKVKYKDSLEVAKIFEYCELEVALIFLRSSFLEKKILGIDEMNKKIKQAKGRSSNLRGFPGGNFDQYTKYLTEDLLRSWMEEKALFDELYGPTCHPEIVKRSTDIAHFLLQESKLSQARINVIWENALSRYQAYKDSMLNLLEELIHKFNGSDLKFLCHKIVTMPHNQVNHRLLQMIKSFNFNLFKKVSIESNETFNPSTYLNFLWDICQGESDEPASEEISSRALSILKDSLIYHVLNERKNFMNKCLENIKNLKNVSLSCELLKNILESFVKIGIPTINSETLIQVMINFKREILSSLLKSFVIHKKQALIHLKSNDVANIFLNTHDKKSKFYLVYSLLKTFVIGKSKKDYINDLSARFELLKFCCANSSEFINDNLMKQIWEILVKNSLCESESDSFYSFLSNLLGNSDNKIISRETSLKLFTNYILVIAPEDYSTVLYNCFEKYFIKINRDLGFIQSSINDGTFKVIEIEMAGIEYLWEIALLCENEEVFFKALTLIKRLFSKQQNVSFTNQLKLVTACIGFITSYKADLPNEKSTNKIWKCLEIIRDYLVNTTFAEFTSQESYQIQVRIANRLSRVPYRENFVEDFFNTTMWRSVKEVLAEKFGKRCEDFTFKINGKIIIGDDNKSLEDLGVHKNSEIEINEGNNPSSQAFSSPSYYLESIQQLKCIFENIEEQIIISALEKSQNELDGAVGLLTDEIFVQTSRSELYSKLENMQIDRPKSPEPEKNHPPPAQKKPEIFRALNDDNTFFKLLFELSDLNIEILNTKIIELISAIGRSESDHSSILSLNYYSSKEILRTHNKVKLWHFLEIIMEILNSENKKEWMIKFFETGGFVYLCKLVLKFKKYSLEPVNKINEKCLESLTDMILKYVEEINGPDSEFSVAIDLIDVLSFIENLIKIIEIQIDRADASETLIEKTLNLLIALARHRSDIYSEIYGKNVFKNLILSTLLKSQSFSLRETIKNSIQTLLCSLPNSLKGAVMPNQYFWNIISKGLPTTSNPDCQEFFDLALAVLESNPEVSSSFLPSLIGYLTNKEIDESQCQDKVVTGYLRLITFLIRKSPFSSNNGLIRYVYNCLFDLDFSGDVLKFRKTPPLFKHPNTRNAAFNLLILLYQQNSENMIFLTEKIALHHVPYNLLRAREFESNRKSLTGFVGLRNFGCTCYMNSLMQQLFMIKPFCDGILEVEYESTQSLSDNLLYQMQVLMANLKFSEKQCFEPRGICNTFKIDGEIVNVRIQQDADEFLNLLFDKLEELLKETQYPMLIRSIIGGNIVHEIKSKEENFPYEGEREEHFFRLSLEVKNNKSLADALDLYVKEDILEGDNRYLCEKYNTRVTATKRCVILSLSNTIFVHLKRFEFNYTDMRRIKINDKFEFPMDINFRKWCKDQEKDDSYYEYELMGVIVHSGTADSGHYYSFIKDRSKGGWFKFDDRYVDNYNFESLNRDCFGGEMSGQLKDGFDYDNFFSAYILVYERKTPLAINLEKIPKATRNVSFEIIQATMSENISFLQECMYFESAYEEFLKKVFSSRDLQDDSPIALEDSLGLKLQEKFLIAQALQNQQIKLNDLEKIEFSNNLSKDLAKNEEAKDPSVKLLRAGFVYALELLVKVNKYDSFKYWKLLLLNSFEKVPSAALWACNMLLSNFSFIVGFFNEFKNDDGRNDFMDFLNSLLKIASNAEEGILDSKIDVIVLPESFFQPNDPIYTGIPIAASRRLLECLMNDLWSKHRNINAITNWMLEVITKFMEQGPMHKRALYECGAASYIVQNTVKFFTQSNLVPGSSYRIIEELIKYCKSSGITSQMFIEKNQEFLAHEIVVNMCSFYQLNTFSEIRLLLCSENLEYYKMIMGELSYCALAGKGDQKVTILFSEIRKLLIAEDPYKIERVRFFFNENVFFSERRTFFEEVRISNYSDYTFCLFVVLWWSDLQTDPIIEKMTLENPDLFVFVSNLNIIEPMIKRYYFRSDINLEKELIQAKQRLRKVSYR